MAYGSRVKPLATRVRISSALQAVMRGPNFTGWGKRPDFTPAHQVDLLTGMGPAGARTAERRRSRSFEGDEFKGHLNALMRRRCLIDQARIALGELG
jgi:hypothetical protein